MILRSRLGHFRRIWALDWEGAVKKARRALDEFFIDGVVTNIPLHREITRDLDFIEGKFNTGYLDKKLPLFNLDAIDHIKEEEQRMAEISALIETIRNNKIKTRH